MRELLYEAAKHYRRGKTLAERGDARGASMAFEDALLELQAVRPQRMRDVLLAQVYLSRHQLDLDAPQGASDLRMGYAYARTTSEPIVRALAERLWRAAVASGRHRAPARTRTPARSERSQVDEATRNEREGRTGRDRRGRGRRVADGRDNAPTAGPAGTATVTASGTAAGGPDGAPPDPGLD